MDHSLFFPKRLVYVSCHYVSYKCVRVTIISTAWLSTAETFPPQLAAVGSHVAYVDKSTLLECDRADLI